MLDRIGLDVKTLTPEECGFGYRTSRFRRHPERFVVLAVTFRLVPGAPGTVRYPELARVLHGATVAPPSVSAVRAAVLELRRSKSMVLDPGDPNRRSVGSFFVNPLIATAQADDVARLAQAAGVIARLEEMPRYPVGTPLEKLSAAWLVERAGFPKGTRRGAVGVSSRHCLALVHHGGGTTADLIALAREIRAAVHARFGVLLQPEPVFLGFATADPVTAP